VSQARKLEAAVIESIRDVKGRGKDGMSLEQQQVLEDAVAALEADDLGVADPTTRPDLLDGRYGIHVSSLTKLCIYHSAVALAVTRGEVKQRTRTGNHCADGNCCTKAGLAPHPRSSAPSLA
jgi:hypothetical protein